MPPQQSPKATPPRAGTSRLLAMKFMNRLGPSDSTPTTSSPLASAPSTPIYNKTDLGDSSGGDDDDDDNDGENGTPQRTQGDEGDDRPSAKRRKVSSGAALAAQSSPTAGGFTVAEMEATMRASMDEEERRRQVAIKRRAAELGDEHWTWNAPLPPHVAAKLAATTVTAKSRLPYAVVRVGFAEIDERTEADQASSPTNSTTPASTNSPQVTSSAKPNIMRFNMKKVGSTPRPSSTR